MSGNRLVLILTLILSILEAVTGNKCNHFFQNSRYSKEIVPVSSGSEFSSALRENVLMLSIHLVNGTKWLNLGGKLDEFKLVLGIPPATSSDLALSDALKKLERKWKSRGVLLNFHPTELSNQVKELSSCAETNFTLWVSYVKGSLEESLNLCPNHNLNVLWNKKFGLDSVFDRVTEDNVFLEKDFQRIRRWIENYYHGTEGNESDERFLKNLYKKLKGGSHEDKFSMIFLEAVLQLADKGKESPRKLDLLPDLQDDSQIYQRGEVESLEDLLADQNLLNRECLMISVRAGPLLHNESLQSFQALLRENPNLTLNIFAQPYDSIPPMRLHEVTTILGKDRIIMQSGVIKEKNLKMQGTSDPKIPRPSLTPEQTGNRSSTLNISVLYFLIFTVTLFQVIS